MWLATQKSLALAFEKPRASFLCDEDFPRTIGKSLKSHGLSIHEFPKRLRGKGLPDVRVLRYASKLGYVLLTKDRDFLHNDSYAELIGRSPGVVRFVNPAPDAQTRDRIIVQFLKEFSVAKIVGCVLQITESTHRYVLPRRNS